MKKLSDYNFCSNWQPNRLNINENEQYVPLMDLDDLRKGHAVKFVGFDDVDNHFGIFIFTDAENNVLEATGDFFSPNSSTLKNLQRALGVLDEAV